MTKLDPHSKLPATREALRLILREYGVDAFEFEPFKRGIANTTVGVVTNGQLTHVLRIYPSEVKTDEQILLALRFQQYLRDAGLQVARIVENTAGARLTILEIAATRWQIVLQEYIDGESKTEIHTPQLLSELGSLQARMHLLGGAFPVAGSLAGWDTLSDYYAVGYDPFQYQEAVRAFIERAKVARCSLDARLPRAWCHLDLDLDGNVIVRNGSVAGVIDFDDLSYAPIAVCLGYSLWNVLHDAGMEEMQTYLRTYNAVRPLEVVERQALSSIIQFRNYEIGALRLRTTGDPKCLKRPMEIERLHHSKGLERVCSSVADRP